MESKPVQDYNSDHEEEDQPGLLTVAVEGNIGSGNSTFLSYCTKDPAFESCYEPLEKWTNVGGINLLDKFYGNPWQYGFAFQMEVLITMYDRYVQPATRPIRLLERSLWSSRYCFQRSMESRGFLDPISVGVLNEFHDTLGSHHKAKPNVIVYLETSPAVSHSRLMSRARTEECAVTLDYLQELNLYHIDWLSELKARKLVHECDIEIFTINADRPLHEVTLDYNNVMEDLKTLSRT